MSTNTETIDSGVLAQLVTALQELSKPKPTIPIDIDLWDIATIATYLKRNVQVVRERMSCLPDFPKAIRLPTTTGRAYPLYKAREVIAWANSHQEKH
jgi:hypothetical protein